MIIKFVESIGGKTLSSISTFYDTLNFTFISILHILNPKSYNKIVRKALIEQIYFMVIKIIPMFMIMALFFGSVIISSIIILATKYGLQNQIGSMIISFIVVEVAPFFTALLMSLRLGTAINTKIAVMNVNGKLKEVSESKIDLINYLVVPRIISGIIGALFLSMLFVFIALNSGYLLTIMYMDMTMDMYTYKLLLINAIEVNDIVLLMVKAIIFGFILIIIPIYTGLKTGYDSSNIHILVSKGMIRLFIVLFFIEGISLLIKLL